MNTNPRLRGDYTRAAPDYSVEQDWSAYTRDDHALFRRLVERQSKLVARYACPEWIEAVGALDAGHEIPKFDDINRGLARATGWRIVAVPGLIPDEPFFTHLANRRFPVTVWLRKPEEFDYIVEPDVFHDFFGHVPLLFDPVYADHLAAYGKGGLKAMRLDAIKMLSRLYWYTIEFGLMKTADGVRAYGAGLLSSGGELAYCVDDPKPRRRPENKALKILSRKRDFQGVLRACPSPAPPSGPASPRRYALAQRVEAVPLAELAGK